MAPTIEYWRATTGGYHLGPPGIEVMTDNTAWYRPRGDGKMIPTPFPVAFRGQVDDALTWINATPAGNVVLLGLEASVLDTGISPTSEGNSASMNHAANSKNLVAQELVGGGGPGPNTNQAVTATFGGIGYVHALAAAINSTPRWDLNTVPGVGGGFWGNAQRVRNYVNRWALLVDPRYFRWSDTNEGYARNQSWFGDWGVSGGNIGITGTQVAAWLGGAGLPIGMPTADQEHAIVATVAAVYANSPAGAGTHVGVRWNPDPNSPMNQQRPPAIGLAHELIHAYYGVRGAQPGNEFGHFSTVLFEYLCVGLGPWDGHTPTENSVRAEWWPNASPLIPNNDALNRKVPPRRIMYN